MREATQKQMNFIEALCVRHGFDSHREVNFAMIGSALYRGSRSHPTSWEASQLIDFLTKHGWGDYEPGSWGDADADREDWEDLDSWECFMGDLSYQVRKGYFDDVQDTLCELQSLARRLPSKREAWEAIAAEHDYC